MQDGGHSDGGECEPAPGKTAQVCNIYLELWVFNTRGDEIHPKESLFCELEPMHPGEHYATTSQGFDIYWRV